MGVWVERPGTDGNGQSRNRTFDADHWIVTAAGTLQVWKKAGNAKPVAEMVTGDWLLAEQVPGE